MTAAEIQIAGPVSARYDEAAASELAGGHFAAIAAGATVITPNRRLATHLKTAFDAAQVRSGKSVWSSADALPYGAFLQRTWEELALAESGAMLLSPQQEIALWETVIETSRLAGRLLNPAAAARSVREAWLIQHEFCMELRPQRSASDAWDSVDSDTEAFDEWSRAYAERLRSAGWIDSGQLPAAIAGAMKRGARSRVRHIVRAGYEAYTPQQQLLFDAFAQAGCVIDDAAPDCVSSSTAMRQGCDDAEAELLFVAGRVRALLAAHADALPRLPRLRIGVVVPDLGSRRSAAMRVFDDVLEPLRVTTPGDPAPRLFNCSLGLPLTDYPMVSTALLILKLASGEITLGEAGALLRSPYVGGADAELASRALADAQLRARGRKQVTPGALLQGVQGPAPAHASRLAALLEAWITNARNARGLRQPPSAWSATFLALLQGLGWPGERTLDSAEYQTFEKFREVIAGLTALDPLRPRLTHAEALSALRRLAADTVFQAEAPEAPVQILGTLESLGLPFDALFVTGLAGDSWPAAPRPNPFLPVVLQRTLNVPHASAEWELQFARRMTQAWLQAAPDVTFSWPQREGERELTMSPLIVTVPVATATVVAPCLLRNALFDARRIETLEDNRAPSLSAGVRVSGGTQMFQNQAACPFRAYGIHRLGARGLEDGADGLDPRERGSLVHQALSVLWRDIGSLEILLALSAAALVERTASAVNAAVDALCRARPDVMSVAFAALERERLTSLLLRLAVLEKQRVPFEVVACEDSRALSIAGVLLTARLDRVDRLADGSHLILDYKTGVANIGAWTGGRPDEPQLPLYAVTGEADVSGIAFVQLRAREVAFKGVTREAQVLPEVASLDASRTLAAQYPDWPALLASWRTALEQLARDYLAGRAEVAPKRYPQTCEYCELGALCRVQELAQHAAAADGEAVENT
jgi:ATP-dependent helicase/nuclease subunit B